MEWRLILDPDLPGRVNMARDGALVRALDSGASSVPTLRLYGWSEPTISIGYLQDPKGLLSFGLPVVRRMTGGRAVLHSSEVTYSVAGLVSDPLFSGGILDTYSVISTCIVAALRGAGIDASLAKGAPGRARNAACFHAPSRFEVMAGGRKLVGSAQRRFRRAFLQHGSILMGADPRLNARVFGPGILKRLSSVAEFSDIGAEGLKELLVKAFAEGFSASFSSRGLSAGEEDLERSLLDEAAQAGSPGDGRDCFT